jgi:hypothetical protein
MGRENKFVFTKPMQIPLFEEEDNGILKQYQKED